MHFDSSRGRGLGFSNKEMENLLSLWRNHRRWSAEVKRLALKHIDELDEKIEELKMMRAALAQLASRCQGDLPSGPLYTPGVSFY